MIWQNASLPRIDIDNLQRHLFSETINVASTDPGSQPSPALREGHTRASRSVRFRIPDCKTEVTEWRTDCKASPHGKHDTESFLSSLPSTVPETMDEALIDENIEAAEIEVETEDREAPGQHTQFSNATQPISQTAYDDVIRSRSEQRSLHSDVEPQDEGNDAEWEEKEDEDLENSIQEGDSNFVDICSSFVPVPDAIDSIPIDISPTQTQHEFTQFRESQRFKTPATAGKKRDHAGNFVESPIESRNPFARGGHVTPGNVVGLSQAFANTQAASSPLPAEPTSELRSDKPSPGLSVERNVKSLLTSSPSRLLSDIWKPTEPSARYVPVRQSQALRQAIASEGRGVGDTQESISDGFNSILSTVQRQRIARERERQARTQMEAASSPTSPDDRVAIQIADPPVRAASERPASTVRHKSKSRSLPSSPPAIETEETTEDIEIAEVENDEPARARSQPPSEEISQLVTSSAGLRNRRNVTTLVPNTSKRTTRSTARPRHNVQPSPSERRTRIEMFVEPASSNPVRVANSQRSIPFTQDADPGIALSTADSVDVIPASPEGFLQSTEPTAFHDQILGKDLAADEAKGDTDLEDHATESADQLKSSNVEQSGIPETSSGILAREKQKLSTYTTALTNQRQDTNSTAMEWSSQPVRTTPPGRKRKRLGEISQEDLVPAASQSSAFDPVEGLALEPEFSNVNPLISQDPDPIHPRKRTRLHSPILAEDDLRQAPSPSATANSANMGRQLRNKHVVVDEDDQDAENTAPSSSLSELTATPNTIKTTPKRPSTSKSIYSPVESPQPRTAPSTGRGETGAAPVGLQEFAASRTRRVISKTTLRTPKSNPTPLQPIEESSPDPLAISAVQLATGTPVPPSNKVVAPHMIFAYYMSTKRTYFPAICQGYSTETEKFTIAWPGYAPEQMDLHGICSLDLRIGDEVRLEREGWPKIIWRVRGFGPVTPVEEGSDSLRDIYGRTTCLLEPKDSKVDLRKLVSRNEPIEIQYIYLDSNQFTRFKKRPFRYSMIDALQSSTNVTRLSTPPVRTSTPSTPSSRGRNIKKDALLQPVTKFGILSNMVFAISTKVENEHPEVADIVRDHGGSVLNSNFHELVTDDMQLRSASKNLSFAALLADRHSRSPKYLQALALGLPCLSWKWVEASAKREKLVNWQDYLLPAGESKELDGAIRSRVLPPFDVANTKLSEMIEKRPKFFTDSSAVFVTGRGKAEVQRKTNLFFIRAMGLTSIEQAIDLPAARLQLAATEKKGKTWLVVEDKDYDAALRTVKSVKPDSVSKRKKKIDTENEWECRVANQEFLVQSLILGRPCETDYAT